MTVGEWVALGQVEEEGKAYAEEGKRRPGSLING